MQRRVRKRKQQTGKYETLRDDDFYDAGAATILIGKGAERERKLNGKTGMFYPVSFVHFNWRQQKNNPMRKYPVDPELVFGLSKGGYLHATGADSAQYKGGCDAIRSHMTVQYHVGTPFPLFKIYRSVLIADLFDEFREGAMESTLRRCLYATGVDTIIEDGTCELSFTGHIESRRKLLTSESRDIIEKTIGKDRFEEIMRAVPQHIGGLLRVMADYIIPMIGLPLGKTGRFPGDVDDELKRGNLAYTPDVGYYFSTMRKRWKLLGKSIGSGADMIDSIIASHHEDDD